MPPPSTTTLAPDRPVRVKSDRSGGRNAGVTDAAALGASPMAPIVASIAPAPPLIPTVRRNPRRLTIDCV